jgi:hypothetical protein
MTITANGKITTKRDFSLAGGSMQLWAFNPTPGCLADLKDNIFEVRAEVELPGERVVIGPDARDDAGAKRHCLADLKGLLADTEYTDFVIKCGGKTFNCHRAILSARSPVFKAMLASGMEEARKGEVTADDVQPGTLEKIIEFIYGGEVEQFGGQGQVEQLLYAADKYGLDDLASTYKLLMVINLWPR